jgi:uncharacterized protein YggE
MKITMRKVILTLMLITGLSATAQEFRQMPLITTNGEGKIKITPDQVAISVSVESKGDKAADVKKTNDTKIDAVIKYIKKMGVPAEDYQTQRVYLNDEYDYDKKKHNYVATQTIRILLKDIKKYDPLMEGLVETGINGINGIEYLSSQMDKHKTEARRLAVLDAKKKATELASALGQSIGSAFTVNDNSTGNYPQPRYEMAMMKVADGLLGNQTLAVGELEVSANVSVSFVLNQ